MASGLQKTLRAASWLLLNGTIIGVTYAGFALEVEGAKNVAMFLVWLIIFGNLTMLSDSAARDARADGRSVPAWVDVSLDIGAILLLVWFGAWITGAFLALSLTIKEGALRNW